MPDTWPHQPRLRRGQYVYVPVHAWTPHVVPPPELHQLATYLGVSRDAFGDVLYRVRVVQNARELTVRAEHIVLAGLIDGHTVTLPSGEVLALWCPACPGMLDGEYTTPQAEAAQTYDLYVCDRHGHEFRPVDLLRRVSYTRAALSTSYAQALASLSTSVQRRWVATTYRPQKGRATS